MPVSNSFIDYVYDQVRSAGVVRHKRMFGGCMFYCDEKPVLLIADDIVYIKKLPEISELLKQYDITPQESVPYEGAKPCYIIDVENGDFAVEAARLLAKILPLPKKKKKKEK